MQLQSGQIVITLADSDPPGKQITLDLIECKLAAEDAERANTQGQQIDTAAMLRDLVPVYERMGVDGCTLTGAWQIYIAINQRFADLKKNTGL